MRILFIALFLLSSASFAGGFPFPNTDYAYAKLYFYNIDWDEKERPDFNIYSDGIYAATKVGDGIELQPETLESIHMTLARGIDEILMGLSKCYIPRHGIIYFDNNNEPVASLSICFECEKISYWTKNKFERHRKNMDKFDIEYAEKQMKDLRKALEKQSILVADSIKTYKKIMEVDEGFKEMGTIEFQRPQMDSLYFKKWTAEELKSWQIGVPRTRLKDDVNVEISAGGDKYEFKKIWNENGTQFDFSSNDEDAFLVSATINDPEFTTPFGIQVGMSLDQVQNFVGIWDGISNPEEVTIKGEKVQITCRLDKHTVQSIRLYFEYLP